MVEHDRNEVLPALTGWPWSRLANELESLSQGLDRAAEWPDKQFALLADSGALGWVIPVEYGGSSVSTVELTRGYERLAQACLTTTFVLTQRNGACQRLAGSDNETLKTQLLPALSSGRLFATVGVSHLTTSRQHLSRPVVAVRQSGATWVFDGKVPWVTGAPRADFIVTGGTCPDGRQVLAVLPTDRPGVSVDAPVPLLALNASKTASVELNQVELNERFLIAGPVENVMRIGQGGGAGSLTTSVLALGTAAGVLNRLEHESRKRPDLDENRLALGRELATIRSDLYRAIEGAAPAQCGPASNESIRHRANSLVIRAAQSFLAASKGAGFVIGHPAERAVRESMFFLVWSCPQPVLAAALREFACGVEP